MGGQAGFGSCSMIGRYLIQFHQRKVKVKSSEVRRSRNHAGLSRSPDRRLALQRFVSDSRINYRSALSAVSVGDSVSSID